MAARIEILSPTGGSTVSMGGLLVVKGRVHDIDQGKYRVVIKVELESGAPVNMRRPGTAPRHPKFTYLNNDPDYFSKDEVATVTVALIDLKTDRPLDTATVKKVTVKARPPRVRNPDYVEVIDPEDNKQDVGGGTGNFVCAGYKSGGALEALVIRRSDSAEWPASPNRTEVGLEDYDWSFQFNNVPAGFRNVPVDVLVRFQADTGNNDKAENVKIN